MAYVIAQLSDTHVGGPHDGGARLTAAIDTVLAMTRAPDLVLLTGDLTHHGTVDEWDEVRERLGVLPMRWEAIPGNHDRAIADLAGHRATDAGPLRLVLLDTSHDVFTGDDAAWLDAQLASSDRPTIIAVHHPPFETGIWWMDCVGLQGKELVEAVVRRHPHVIKVLSGHVHRPIQTNWGACPLWVSPSTSVAVAVDLDPAHDPAESAEAPAFSVHAYTGAGIVSHVVPIGTAAARSSIDAAGGADFVTWAREVQRARSTVFD